MQIINDNLAMTVNTRFYDILLFILALFIDMYVLLCYRNAFIIIIIISTVPFSQRKALNVAQLQEEDRRLAEAARKRPWMQTEVSEHIEKAARYGTSYFLRSHF